MLLSEELKNTVKNFIDEKLEPNNWVGTCMENYLNFQINQKVM